MRHLVLTLAAATIFLSEAAAQQGPPPPPTAPPGTIEWPGQNPTPPPPIPGNTMTTEYTVNHPPLLPGEFRPVGPNETPQSGWLIRVIYTYTPVGGGNPTTLYDPIPPGAYWVP